jgi:hypothetical protein
MEQSNWVKRSFPTFIRLLRRGVQVVIVILIILVVVHTVLNVVLHRRVAAKLAEIKRAGGAITLSELMPDPVPDRENAAVHYFYALSIMERPLAEESVDLLLVLSAFNDISRPRSMTSQRQRRAANGAAPAPLTLEKLPSGLVPRDVAVDDRGIQAATEYLEKVQPSVDTDGREIELAARHIFTSGKMARGLQVVKDARELDRALLLHDYDLGVESVAGLILPRLARFRALSRWVASAAVLAAWDGDMNEAFDLVSSGLHIANGLRDEPILIAQLVRVAIGGIAIGAMYEIMDENCPPDEQVPMIVAELDKLRDREPFARALQGERCFAIAQGRRLAGLGYVARPFRLLDQLAYLEYMPEVIDLAALPAYESRHRFEELEHQVSTISKLKVTARLVIPAFARGLESQDRFVAQCDLAEMAMYLKQYKRKTGSYPEKPDAIAPDYIRELPVDPFTGTPYVYRKEGEGFVLYSVARNSLDDGGKPGWLGGDIVWRSSR